MKPISLEEAPQALQEAVKKYLDLGYELLEITAEEQFSGKLTYEANLTTEHKTFVNLHCFHISLCGFVVDERKFDDFVAIKALELSKTFRKRVQRHIRGIERKEQQNGTSSEEGPEESANS
ncbi:hypothetical protein M3215_11425 [Bacillus cytotoxicus]|uniref:Uncharacterized protein n=1 Tax=Bacillus cytotoxicus TaxID=580165 RepID=A0ACC6A7H0_9BACI|nr:hypothetical protein [Bacillus cytotoxicus]